MTDVLNTHAHPIWTRLAKCRAFPLTIMLGVIVLTRIICRSHLLYDVDSVNFALALKRFDPSVHQPHPPGYFLYVLLGRVVNSVVQDPNTTLVWVSIVASVAAAGSIYALTTVWFGRKPAMMSLLLFLFSPLCWFHGTVALTYIVEAFFSALVGYSCWRMQLGSGRWVLAASVFLGLSAGFRPSSLIFLLPLWVFSLRRCSPRSIWSGIFVLSLTLAGWFGPMVWSAGGFAIYADALKHLWGAVPGRTTVLNGHWAMSIARALTMIWIYVLCFGFAAPLIFCKGISELDARREKLIFTAVWLLPGVTFFTLGFLLFVNSGYVLVLCPPVFAWLSGLLERLHARTAARRAQFLAALTAGCLANCLWFLYAPVYCSHRSVRSFEQRMNRIAADVRHRFDPADTMIVGFDSHFLGYRHAAYYLPEYLTVQYPEVQYPEGRRVFAVRDRETTLKKHLNLDRYSRFVLFPLPQGEAYTQYLKTVRDHFSPDRLRCERAGSEVFVTGSTADLPAIFPHTLPWAHPYIPVFMPVNRLYTRVHKPESVAGKVSANARH